MDMKAKDRAPVMTAEEVAAFLDKVFPAVRGKYDVMEITPMRALIRAKMGDADIRPGGTISGPSMFGAVDCAFYAALLAMIGEVALTVTTNATINFLNKPAPRDLICEARIMKLGKLLATGDATLWSEGDDRPVAHATLTYAIPPK